jgi:serine/threonine protein kinase
MSLANILWLVVVVIIALWLIGLITRVAGNLIHLLLLVALAVLVYNLVTGRPPFSGDNAIAIGFAHCTETAEAPKALRKDCPPKLSDAIMAALAKAPGDRPSSAKSFLALALT